MAVDPGMLADLDGRVLLAIYGGAGGAWALPMVAATVVGAGWTALVLLPLLGWRRTRRFAMLLTFAVATQAIAVWALKAAVGRVRPWIALGLPAPFGAPHDPSFPSGHAAGSFCVAAFLTLALPAAWRHAPRRARAVAGGVLALAALVALSRVYLGAHFPGDVLAGAILGGTIGALWGRRYARGPARARSPGPGDVDHAAQPPEGRLGGVDHTAQPSEGRLVEDATENG
ncbi:MAG TPA: phosphatase PAP2 family protein [Polyangiaceae bacterium]